MLCWARIWLCWACWAGLGEDLALLGALGWVGRGVWPCWDLALLGALGWVGRGIWSCKAGWAGLGVRFGSGGRRKKSQKTRLLWVLSDLIDLLAVFRVYAGIILMKWFLLQTQISFTLSPVRISQKLRCCRRHGVTDTKYEHNYNPIWVRKNCT